MTEKLRKLLLADDHALLGDLLETFLSTKDYEVVRAYNYEDIFTAIQSDHEFDIVVLDIMMPGFKNIHTIRSVVEQCGRCPVVALTSIPSSDFSKEAIEAGLSGYLQKTMSLKKIPIVLEFILSGEIYIEGIVKHPSAADNEFDLSPIEKRVLSMISEGYSNKEIAIATDTTETYVKSINRTLSRKLHVKNRTQLALKVVRNPDILGPGGAAFKYSLS